MILVGIGKRLLELEAKQLILGTTVTIMQTYLFWVFFATLLWNFLQINFLNDN
jgi:hypothetical protein